MLVVDGGPLYIYENLLVFAKFNKDCGIAKPYDDGTAVYGFIWIYIIFLLSLLLSLLAFLVFLTKPILAYKLTSSNIFCIITFIFYILDLYGHIYLLSAIKVKKVDKYTCGLRLSLEVKRISF